MLPLDTARASCGSSCSTGVPPSRRRGVTGCATPTGSAGHAGATANLKLTFHLDHSAGADQGANQDLALSASRCRFHSSRPIC
jgi:hypothetical protein